MGVSFVSGEQEQRPVQAVVFAGGRGTRLAPLTDTRPKGMIELHGRPFFHYMLEMLREQGFGRVLFLLGYLPDVVVDYFGDGSRFGMRIDYSITEPDDLTGHRLRTAANLLDRRFLLLYSDNYWQMRFDEMWASYVSGEAPVQMTVYANLDGFTRSNVAVADGIVRVYDRTRTAPGLQGVDIGYAIVDRDAMLDLVPSEQVTFEEAVYEPLVRRGALGAYMTQDGYYSVGSLDRLDRTEEFLGTLRSPTRAAP